MRGRTLHSLLQEAGRNLLHLCSQRESGAWRGGPSRKWLADCGFLTMIDFLTSVLVFPFTFALLSSIVPLLDLYFYGINPILQTTLHWAHSGGCPSSVAPHGWKIWWFIVPWCHSHVLLHVYFIGEEKVLCATLQDVYSGTKGWHVSETGAHGADDLLWILLFLTLILFTYIDIILDRFSFAWFDVGWYLFDWFHKVTLLSGMFPHVKLRQQPFSASFAGSLKESCL